VSTEDAPEPAAAPGRIALRSPLEAFLWIFITRLIALLTASRLPSTDDRSDDDAIATNGSDAADPARARRVASSGPARPAVGEPDAPAPTAPGTDHARAVTITAATAVVGAAAAFALGRRRGAR